MKNILATHLLLVICRARHHLEFSTKLGRSLSRG